MKIEKYLIQKKAPIVGQWLDLIFETYPADARRFLRKQKDRFANPVGTTITKEIENLYDEIIQGLEPDRISALLDGIIRIRAVQDFSPSQAISFVFHLKKAIKENLQKEILEKRLSEDLSAMESRIDDLALLAFDVYMNCREKLYEIQANAARNQVSRLLKKAGMIVDFPDKHSNLRKGSQTEALNSGRLGEKEKC